MTTTSDDRLNEIAAELAAAIIRENDKRELVVSLIFRAKRSDKGLWLSDITLGYDQPKKGTM